MDLHTSGQDGAGGPGRRLPWTGTEASHTFPPEVIGQIHEMAEVGRYEIRGWGAKRYVPSFDDLVFLTASRLALPARGLPGAMRHDNRARVAVREPPPRAGDPDHDRRHELRLALGQRQGGARQGGDGGGDLDDDRRRRHDPRGADGVAAARVPVPAFALRVQPRRPAPGRRDRGRDRPRRQARRRRACCSDRR